MARGPSQFPSVASSIVERGRGVITTRGRLAAASLDRAQLHRERRHLARARPCPSQGSTANAFASGSESPEEEASSRSASRATAPPVGSKSSSGSSVLTGAGFASPASSAARPPPARLVLVFIGRLARLALGRQSAAAVFFRVRAAARTADLAARPTATKIRLNGRRVLFRHTHARGRSATTRGAPAASRDGRRVLDAHAGATSGLLAAGAQAQGACETRAARLKRLVPETSASIHERRVDRVASVRVGVC